jgi:hypothetical protein
LEHQVGRSDESEAKYRRDNGTDDKSQLRFHAATR